MGREATELAATPLKGGRGGSITGGGRPRAIIRTHRSRSTPLARNRIAAGQEGGG